MQLGKIPLWQPEALSSHHTPSGPLQKGTQIENRARGAGFTLNSTSTIREFNPGEKIAFDVCAADDRVNAHLIWSTEPKGDGTRFSVHANYKLRGLFKLSAPIFVPIAERTISQHLQNLKSVLEAGN